MLNYQYAKSGAPANKLSMKVQCRPSPLNSYFVRTTGVPTNQDEKFYDLGDFTLAYQGIPTGTAHYVVGELWIGYTITLTK